MKVIVLTDIRSAHNDLWVAQSVLPPHFPAVDFPEILEIFPAGFTNPGRLQGMGWNSSRSADSARNTVLFPEQE